MIRRELKDGWILFAQFDHSKLSGDIMKYWGNKEFSNIRSVDKVMYSITNHDKGWENWDSNPRVNPENNYPANFMDMFPSEQHRIWAKCYEDIPQEYSYSSALIALHFSKFNNNLLLHMPENKEVLEFKNKLNKHVSDILKIDKNNLVDNLPEDVVTDLKFIQLGDIISLTLCSGWKSAEVKDVPVNYNDIEVNLRLESQNGLNYTLKPYPFSEKKLDLEISGLRIKGKRFGSDNDLRLSIKNAELQKFKFSIN